jgi:hypothetical protein
MARWEYKFETLDLEEREKSLDQIQSDLNELGRAGWEVASILPKVGSDGSRTVALLKREIATLVAKHN